MYLLFSAAICFVNMSMVVGCCYLVTKSCLTLWGLMDHNLPWDSSSPLGDLPDPGIKPTTLLSPALGGEFFTICATWEALISLSLCCFILCKYVHGAIKAEKQAHIRSIFFKFASFNSISIWSDIFRCSVFCPEKDTVHIKQVFE